MYSCDAKAEFWAPFPQSSVSHDPSEIILILYADLVPKKHVFIIISVENCVSYARQQIWYHMHTKTVFYMHAKHVRIIYTPKSIFFRINTTSFHFYLAYYLYAFSWAFSGSYLFERCDTFVSAFFNEKKTWNNSIYFL